MGAATPGELDDLYLTSTVRAAEGEGFGRIRRPRTGRGWAAFAIFVVLLATAVALIVHARQPDPFVLTKKVAWTHPVVTNRGRDVTVSFEYGNCASTSVRTTVEETPTAVVLTVVLVERYPGGGDACAGKALRGKAVALLARPLGSRKLVDGVR